MTPDDARAGSGCATRLHQRRLRRRLKAAIAAAVPLIVSAPAASANADDGDQAAQRQAIQRSEGRAVHGRVLTVGMFRGKAGEFTSIQGAVDAARPGDWVLIAPGDYHESGHASAGVLITTPNIHIRGMDRNKVIVDGTRPGARACSDAAGDQLVVPGGRNGLDVERTSGVSIENLTACNFLGGANGENGNQVWWNGGGGTGEIGMGSFHGGYLTASSSFFSDAAGASYGVFVSNASGPGVIEHAYASNMDDSSFYVGACGDCNTILRHVHAQNSALGYSGTNAGGHLIIEDSEWDMNRVGIAPNTLANDDPPPPQDGACPAAPTRSCTIIRRNFVHDNNNANSPAVGLTAGSPVGTGIEISGGRNDTIVNNLVTGNGAWGILLNDFADTSAASVPAFCRGGLPHTPFLGQDSCWYVAFGNQVRNNRLAGNGAFANATNGDLAAVTLPWTPASCFVGNRDPDGLTSAPANIQSASVLGRCGDGSGGGDLGPTLNQLLCASFGLCPDGGTYPQRTALTLLPIPHNERTMRNPCDGVPRNSWCGDDD